MITLGAADDRIPEVDRIRFEEVMAHYPTGVAVVTSRDALGRPIGAVTPVLAVLSTVPPLIGIQLDPAGPDYLRLTDNDRFCVNIIASGNSAASQVFRTENSDDLDSIDWVPSVSGSPIISGSSGWIDCRVNEIHDTGNRKLLVCRVLEVETNARGLPLLFFRGGRGGFDPRVSILPSLPGLTRQIELVERGIAAMEIAADEAGVEVIAMARHGNSMSIIASAAPRGAEATTLVGRRFPFVPPYGTLFLAGSDEQTRNAWFDELAEPPSDDERNEMLARVSRADERGWSVALSGPAHSAVDRMIEAYTRGPVTSMLDRRLRSGIASLGSFYDPPDEELLEAASVRMFCVPVPDRGSEPLVQLAVHSLAHNITVSDLPALRAILTHASAQMITT
ncbi:flavin reductase family protein [Rhodococcoides kyotonense]|uniref:NADH-FMN oxidoreductase RutF, flavin reductase (DIM6/NTAB) family n=1 Tax=Rhodococcoides kyotonense TaxID=398843 RepID=A0A239MZN7_9NOCA|nr:flavin reductase family protein [Rhodococcus kyotonensis]SNT48095.1 NADH-FMN oxidoreductase RutF, flavin reductase (DIM6/NTAB) family [Rhodococcus kyotonensis]